MSELKVEAKVDNLTTVLEFIDELLEQMECSMKTQMQIDVAVEEMFVNVASYAYGDDVGMATIVVDERQNPHAVAITIIDTGVPYDPLAKEDPDVTLSANERQIGGLGIYMVKKSMDDVLYEYTDGQNIFTMIKNL
ncbi:MAG: ATP-binding protein [Clostridia bacterium]|nr:ATP-binding protein [Clostridia bacterium]